MQYIGNITYCNYMNVKLSHAFGSAPFSDRHLENLECIQENRVVFSQLCFDH